MVYVPNSPLGSQRPSLSRAQINENFQQLNTQYGEDHVAFDSSSNNGFHDKVTFPDATAPTPTASTTKGVLYSALDGNNAAQLFFVNKTKTVQLTGTGSTDVTTGSLSDGGNYTVLTLTSGLRMFMGTTASGSGARNLTMSSSTFGSVIYTAQATVYGAGPIATSLSPNPSTNSFNIQSGNTAPIYFLIITN